MAPTERSRVAGNHLASLIARPLHPSQLVCANLLSRFRLDKSFAREAFAPFTCDDYHDGHGDVGNPNGYPKLLEEQPLPLIRHCYRRTNFELRVKAAERRLSLPT